MQANVDTGPLSHTLLIGFDYQHLKDRVIFSSGDASSLDYRDPDYVSRPAPTCPTSISAP